MQTLKSEASADAFFRRIEQSKRSMLLLDYDGTLAPFHVRPMMALPYAGVVDSLNNILATGGTRVVVLSGRRAEEVATLLPLRRRPEIWGLDGWERLMPDGHITVMEPPAQSHPDLQELLQTLRSSLPTAARVEARQASVVVHSRGVPLLTAAKIKENTTRAWQQLPCSAGIDMVPFDGGFELRDRESDRNAASEILSQAPHGVPAAYLGDDLSDEKGFAAVGNGGLGVLVRPTLRPTAADLWIRPPRELVDFLSRWNGAMKATRH